MPSGVWLGMSSGSLSENRPNITSISSASAANESQYVEIVKTEEPNIAYWYRFKDGVLGAVSQTIRVVGLSKDQVFRMSGEAFKKYDAEFILIGTQKIVRSFNAESTLLTAQHWQKKDGNLQGYIVVSSHEITQVLFDPKRFGFSDFFLSAERLPDVQANEKVVREMMKDIQNTKPQSNLAPLVDLLPEVAKESVSTPTSMATTQATPAPTQHFQSMPVQRESTKFEQSTVRWPWILGGILLLAIAGRVLFKFLRK